MTLGSSEKGYVRVFDVFGRVFGREWEVSWMVEGWWLRN